MLPPSTLPGGERQDSGKLAAQRAFFEALGKAQVAAAAQAVAPAASIQPTQAVRAAPAPAPADTSQKILRPGSLLDIRV